MRFTLKRVVSSSVLSLGLSTSILFPSSVQAKDVDCPNEDGCVVAEQDTLVVPSGKLKKLRNPKIKGSIKIENGATLTIESSNLVINNKQQEMDVQGKLVVGKRSKFLFTGGAKMNVSGEVVLEKDSELVVESSSVLKVERSLIGGEISVSGGELILANAQARIGKKSPAGATTKTETAIKLDLGGTLTMLGSDVVAGVGELPDPRIPRTLATDDKGFEVRTVPNPALCNIVGSLTMGSGTFNTTIVRTGNSSNWVYTYGQLAIYGDVVINNGCTLNVTESPANTFNPIGVNFDIIWADHVKRTQTSTTAMAKFDNVNPTAGQYEYRMVVPYPTPTPDPYSAVLRIKDTVIN